MLYCCYLSHEKQQRGRYTICCYPPIMSDMYLHQDGYNKYIYGDINSYLETLEDYIPDLIIDTGKNAHGTSVSEF